MQVGASLPFSDLFACWRAALADGRRIDLYLDKAGLHDGVARGFAALSAGDAPLSFAVEGRADGERLDVALVGRGHAQALHFAGVRRERGFEGELREPATGAAHAVAFAPAPMNTKAAMPLKGGPDPVPVNVTYDVSTSGGSFHFANFTVIPWPIGTWRGSNLWGHTDGFVCLGFSFIDLFEDVLVWSMMVGLSPVGTLYCRRSQMGPDKTADLVDGTVLWLNDRWTKVTGSITQHQR